MVGAGGSNLSGGQKQLIAIARALITKPMLLLLDEATSALDYMTEKSLQHSLARVCKTLGTTTLVISHHLSSVHDSDSIVVFRQGSVAEVGNHADLVNLKGIYCDLLAQEVSRDHDDSSGSTEPQETAKAGEDGRPDKEEDPPLQPEPVQQQDMGMSPQTMTTMRDGGECAEKGGNSAGLLKALRMASPEKFTIMLACLAAVVAGTGICVYSWLFKRLVELYELEPNEAKSQSLVLLYILPALLVFGTISSFAHVSRLRFGCQKNKTL